MAKTLVVNCDVHAQWEKDEDGEKTLRNYRRGDEVSVTNGVAERLLRLQVGGRPLFVQSEKEMEEPDNTEGLRPEDALGPKTEAKIETQPTATRTAPTTRGVK